MKNKKNIVLALIAVIIYVVIFSLAQFGDFIKTYTEFISANWSKYNLSCFT